jgi:replication factor A1
MQPFSSINLNIIPYNPLKMQIKDLKPKMGNVDVTVDVVDVGDPREFNKFGKPGRVATAIAKDESGDVKLTLWNDDIDKIKAGDKVHLTNGYVNEWQGEIQLTTGRMGKMEVVGKSESSSSGEIKTNVPNDKDDNNDSDESPTVEEESVEDSDSDDEEI